MPRSPLWQYLTTWDRLLEKKIGLKESAKRLLDKSIKLDASLPKLMVQIDVWASGRNGLTSAIILSLEQAGKDLLNLKYWAFFLNKVSRDQASAIKEKYEGMVVSWDESKALAKIYGDLKCLQKEIGDEIAIVTLRRVIPGNCLYCPL